MFYILISFISCTIGALGGMGGGMILKPILESVTTLPLSEINFLSASTVFIMTGISLFKMRSLFQELNPKMIAWVIIGALGGGQLGSMLFQYLLARSPNTRMLGIGQSALLTILVFIVILVEIFSDRLPRYSIKNNGVAGIVGVFLGGLASFLGIGGGPFNKPMFYHLFGLSSKGSAFFSLLIIFFSQIVSVASSVMHLPPESLRFELLPLLAIGGILGGYVGSNVVMRVSDKYFNRMFIGVVMVIEVINLYNLGHYIFIVE